MLVSDLINEKNLLPDLVAKDRNSAYQIMVHSIVSNGFMKSDLSSSSLEGLQAREAKMTTAMGGGFALPHATIPKLLKPCFLLAPLPPRGGLRSGRWQTGHPFLSYSYSSRP